MSIIKKKTTIFAQTENTAVQNSISMSTQHKGGHELAVSNRHVVDTRSGHNG